MPRANLVPPLTCVRVQPVPLSEVPFDPLRPPLRTFNEFWARGVKPIKIQVTCNLHAR